MAAAAVDQAPGIANQNHTEPQIQETNKSGNHDITAEVFYYKDHLNGPTPAPVYLGLPKGAPLDPLYGVNVLIRDIAGEEEKYTLDSHGFQYVPHESGEKVFDDDEKIKSEYYEETAELLKKVTGATRVLPYNHTVRRATRDIQDGDSNKRGPARQVHIDQAYDVSRSLVQKFLPEEAEELLKKRVRVINVWRPIKPIHRDPLAAIAAASVEESDLVPIRLIYPDKEGTTVSIKENSAHQWLFKYGQRPDEPLLLKLYDSVDDGKIARRTPHTSFVDPEAQDARPRESIEVRTVVFG